MNKILFTFIVSLLLGCFSNAQELKKVDEVVLKYPASYRSASLLAKRIKKDFSTDLEKVRASYTWITEHIAYSYNENQATSRIYKSYENDLKLSRDMGQRVLQTKQAICSGYSQLFQSLMNELGITSRVVNGSAKTEIDDIGRGLSVDHAWNIVTINNKQYLIDATWGAGSWGTEFIKERTYNYFMTDPELFANKHFPQDPKDLLLEKKVSKREFSYQPLLFSELMKDVKVLSPKSGVLERREHKNTFTFELVTELKQDWISYRLGLKQVNPQIEETDSGYKFVVDLDKNPTARSLTIFFGKKALAGYRIK